MKTLCVLFVIGLVASHGLGFRLKRQATEQEGNLEDRYGWDQQTWLEAQWQILGQFPNQEQLPGRFPGQFPGGQQQLTTSTTATPSTTTSSSGDVVATMSNAIRTCIANCPVTSEYNPVCGTDSNTYNNPGRLECAKACGVSVNLFRTSPCPPPTQPPQ